MLHIFLFYARVNCITSRVSTWHLSGQVSEAVDLLREIRSSRGDISMDDLNTITTEMGYIEAMLTDARKEFIGEGQSFYLFKRLNPACF